MQIRAWTSAPNLVEAIPGAGIAQLVEHVICNLGVAGSNPAAGTISPIQPETLLCRSPLAPCFRVPQATRTICFLHALQLPWRCINERRSIFFIPTWRKSSSLWLQVASNALPTASGLNSLLLEKTRSQARSNMASRWFSSATDRAA